MNKNKFRAYDKENHKWVDCNILLGYDGSLWWNFGYKLEILSPDEAKKIDIQFSTGLKDKNNKEVYIGDIVAYKNKDINNNFIEDRFIVKFGKYDNDMYYEDKIYAYRIYMENYMLIKNNKKEIFDFEGFWGIDELEIIGNIYDNPELLKEV